MSKRHLYRSGILAVLGCFTGMGLLVARAHADHGSYRHVNEHLIPVTQLLDIYECTRCHRLHAPNRLIGPSLWKLGERRDPAAIRASILTPNAIVTPGYPSGLMQQRLQEVGFYDDIARQPALLDRLVAYLSGTSTPPLTPDGTALWPAPSLDAMTHLSAGAVFQPDGQRVETPAFAIDTKPVTKDQFAAFITDGGYHIKRHWDRSGWAIVVKRRDRVQPLGWETSRDASSPQPVVGVTWYEADAYCRWRGKTLPTAAQWQRACRNRSSWLGTTSEPVAPWEWTAEAQWKGSQDTEKAYPERCAAQIQSYRALDGPQTGFRCAVKVDPTHAAAPPALSTEQETTRPSAKAP